ncbi:hypothetical protein ACYCFC_17745 [Stutzerimonas sp. NM35]
MVNNPTRLNAPASESPMLADTQKPITFRNTTAAPEPHGSFASALQQAQSVQPAQSVAVTDTQVANSLQPEKASHNVVEEFMAYMQMSSAEKIRHRILQSMDLTEEDLENMSPEERNKIEQIITEQIRKETELQVEKQLADE